jgi:hypothetical protein
LEQGTVPFSGGIDKISAMDPRLQTLSNTLGLPGADEAPKPMEIQRRLLPEFPASEYAMQLFDAYCGYVAPIFNIIHPVQTVLDFLISANREIDD